MLRSKQRNISAGGLWRVAGRLMVMVIRIIDA